MPQVERLSAIGFQRGENSRDKPTDIEKTEWHELVNMEPGEEAARVRGGIPLLRTLPRTIDWAFPFRSTSKRKLFVGRCGTDLVQFDTTGSLRVIRAAAFPTESVIVCAERIGDAVLVNCDYRGSWNGPYSVTESDGVLAASSANIRRPDAVVVTIEAFADLIPSDPGPAAGGLVPNPDAVTFPQKSCRMAAVTFVRRTDDAAFSGVSPITTDTWADAVAESWENIDERGFFAGVDSADALSQRVNITITGAVPFGATHARVWVTQLTEWDSVGSADAAMQVAAGSSLRYLRDIAISELADNQVASTQIDKTEGQLAGQIHLSDTLGANEIPPATQIKYLNGRLWATGAKVADSAGVTFYSNVINGIPSRSLTQFNLSDQMVETSVDGTEATMGLCSSRGHLFIINENDVWILRNGDPSQEPIKIAEGMGTSFPGTICENGQQAFYLSNLGPAVISGESVELLEEDFKVADVWPKVYNGTGHFFELDRNQRRNVKAFWFRDVWYVTDGSATACMKAQPGKNGGGFHVTPAQASGVVVTNFCKHSDSEAFIVSGDKLCRWMTTSSRRDGNGFYFTAIGRSRGIRIDGRMRWKSAEAWDILALARWADRGELLLTLEGQFGRTGEIFRYSQRTILDDQQEFDISDSYREVIQQSVQQGRLSTWFMPGFRKVIRGDFDIEGMHVGILPREGRNFEYVSTTESEPLPPIDEAMAIFDDRFNGGFDG